MQYIYVMLAAPLNKFEPVTVILHQKNDVGNRSIFLQELHVTPHFLEGYLGQKVF